MGWLLETDTLHWVPLWFCGGLLIYNADRLRRDPADAINLPVRSAASARYRTASLVTLALAVLVLIGLPVWHRHWLLLGLVLGGGLVALGYSIPVLGFRWKDVPLIKTLIAPAVVTLAIFGLILLGDITPGPDGAFTAHYQNPLLLLDSGPLFACWAFTFLLFNMVLCDLRDLAGDRQSGIRSIPVLWGEKGARRLLWALAVAGQLLLMGLIREHDEFVVRLIWLSLLSGLHQAWLLHATERPRSERFYEWAVEGLLYVPALACGLTLLLAHFTRGET